MRTVASRISKGLVASSFGLLLVLSLACGGGDDVAKSGSLSVSPSAPASIGTASAGISSPPPDPLHVDSTPGPELSENQKTEALQIVTDTPGVAHTIATAGHSIQGVGIWLDQDGVTTRGAFIFIRLTTPQTIEGDWPVINHHSSIERVEHKTVCDVSDVDVYVDLGQRKVVSIEPILATYPTARPCTGVSATGGP